MQYSSLFVTVMGMGVTFAGLTCIIFLTQLMGWILGRTSGKKESEKNPETPAPAPAPEVPADGLTDEVRLAILAALAQEPGMRLENARITIRRI